MSEKGLMAIEDVFSNMYDIFFENEAMPIFSESFTRYYSSMLMFEYIIRQSTEKNERTSENDIKFTEGMFSMLSCAAEGAKKNGMEIVGIIESLMNVPINTGSQKQIQMLHDIMESFSAGIVESLDNIAEVMEGFRSSQ